MNESIQRWLTILVICAVAGIAALSVYGMWQVNRIYIHATQGAIKTIPGVVDLMDARLHVTRLRQMLYQHVASTDIADKAVLDASIKDESAHAVEALRHHALFMADTDDEQMLSVEHRMQEEYLGGIPEIMSSSYAGNTTLARALLQEQSEVAGMLDDALVSHLRHHIAHGGNSNSLAEHTFEEASRQTLLFVLIMAAAILVLGHVIAKRIRMQVDRIQELARDNAMFRSMVDCVSDRAVFVIDPLNLSRIIYANAAASRHFGVEPATLKTWRPRDFDPNFEQHLAESINADGFCQFESEHRVADGELIPVEVTLNAFDHEGHAFSVCMVLDLRPQREAEARMRALERLDAEQVSARQLTRFAQSVPGFMFTMEQITDGQFGMLYASPAVEGILGLSAWDVLVDVGNIRDQILQPDLKEVLRLMAESGREMTPLHVTYRIQHPSRGLRWLEANAMPSAMEDGSMQWHGFITDVTDRKQVDEQLAAQERELRTLVDNTPDVIIRYDRDCRRTWISPNYAQVYGSPVAEALGKKPTEVWGRPRMSPSVYESLLQQVMEEGMARDIELDWYDDAGEYVCQSLRVVPEYGSDGAVVSALSLTRDVSEIKQAGMMLADHQAEMVRLFQELSTHEQHQRALLDNFPFFVWLKDTESRLLAANSAYARVARVADTRDLEGKTDFDFFPHDLAQAYVEDDRAVMASGQTRNVVEAYQNDDGERRWMETWKSPMYVDGRLSGTVGFARDVTDHVQREQELRTLVENTPDTIARYDRNCRRVFANSRMLQDCNATHDQLLGKSPTEFPGWDYSGRYEQTLREVMETGEPGSFEISMRLDNGQYLCRHIRLAPEFGADGKVASVLAVGRDISEIDAYRKQIHSMAFVDQLTDLPNRSSLNNRIRQIVTDDAWHSQFGLMVLDLDRFKEVNDTLGHGVGDRLLREAAARLLDCVRTYDMVARLGGDEFAVLVPEIGSSADLDAIAHKILGAFNQPFMIDGRELFISTSIGISQYPRDCDDVDTLFQYADSAMYHAKKQHGNNCKFYSAELTANLAGRLQIESALRKAVRRQELELYYQPQIDLASGCMVGAEALLRWNRDGKGLVPPDHFIPIAEKSGLIVSIGEWVLSSACENAAAWNRDRETPLCIAVNLSSRQFVHNDLVGAVKRILEKTGCAPQWIKLEITEGLLLEDNKEISDMLEALNHMGLALSIDDFGTGYSALSYLNRFPVGQIKIDRSFVQGVPDEHDKTELVKAMISISQALELDLVAEGVETQEQADCLLEKGCRTVQGYLFGKPMPKADFEQLMASGR